jgi:ferritin
MISKAMQDAVNEQINKELYSSYLYLSMAAYFENKNLPGFAKWLHVQTDEERGHGMKFYQHLVDRGGRVMLQAIAAPATEWKSYLDVFKEVQAHEAKVTASINSLYELALKEKD